MEAVNITASFFMPACKRNGGRLPIFLVKDKGSFSTACSY